MELKENKVAMDRHTVEKPLKIRTQRKRQVLTVEKRDAVCLPPSAKLYIKKSEKSHSVSNKGVSRLNTHLPATSNKRTCRSLPKPPSPSNCKSVRKKTKSTVTASELKEVPVVQPNTVPFYCSLPSDRNSARAQNDPDLILGLPQQSDLLSMSHYTSASATSLSFSADLEPGSVLDGWSTYRSVGDVSMVVGGVTSTPRSQGHSLLSPRPLPQPQHR